MVHGFLKTNIYINVFDWEWTKYSSETNLGWYATFPYCDNLSIEIKIKIKYICKKKFFPEIVSLHLRALGMGIWVGHEFDTHLEFHNFYLSTKKKK